MTVQPPDKVHATGGAPEQEPVAPALEAPAPEARTSESSAPFVPKKIGIVAGWGSFPVEVAQELKRQGHQVYSACIKGHADERLTSCSDSYKWIGVARLDAQIRFLVRAGVQEVVFAGKIFKDKLLHSRGGWLEHFPDLGCVRVLWRGYVTRTRDLRDDTILNAITEYFANRGLTVLPITDVAPKLLVAEGQLTKRSPSRVQAIDVRFGWNIAWQMGGLDVGQSITIKDQMVLAVEAIEGTDALIQRTGQLCPRGGFTLVKLAKPNQDMRFDVPTIGLRTIEQMAKAGGTAIAIEAGRTLLVEREETLRLADKLGISIVALKSPEASILSPGDCGQDTPVVPFATDRAA